MWRKRVWESTCVCWWWFSECVCVCVRARACVCVCVCENKFESQCPSSLQTSPGLCGLSGLRPHLVLSQTHKQTHTERWTQVDGCVYECRLPEGWKHKLAWYRDMISRHTEEGLHVSASLCGGEKKEKMNWFLHKVQLKLKNWSGKINQTILYGGISEQGLLSQTSVHDRITWTCPEKQQDQRVWLYLLLVLTLNMDVNRECIGMCI